MQIAVLPDAARVEERLARLARQRGFVAGKVACSLAELERGLVREAQQAGTCPQIASPFALQLALRQAARDHSPGPYFAIRNHAGYARALGDLLAALTEGLLGPEELADPAPELELFDPAEQAPAFAPFLRRLFAADGPPADAPVELVSCATPGAQAREVARRCAGLIRSGAAPDSIAVAARSLANGAAEELGAALDRVGVSWRERRGRPALPAPPLRLALSLLELIDQDFPREPLIELLSSRLLWLAEDGETLPPTALARVLRESHVRDDATAGGYLAALSSLARRLERKERSAAYVEETSRRVQRVIAALRRLPAQGTLREHGAALLGLLDRWGLFRRLRAKEPVDAGLALGRAAASALGRDQAAARALEEACAGLAAAAARIGEVRMGRTEFAQLLAQK